MNLLSLQSVSSVIFSSVFEYSWTVWNFSVQNNVSKFRNLLNLSLMLTEMRSKLLHKKVFVSLMLLIMFSSKSCLVLVKSDFILFNRSISGLPRNSLCGLLRRSLCVFPWSFNSSAVLRFAFKEMPSANAHVYDVYSVYCSCYGLCSVLNRFLKI